MLVLLYSDTLERGTSYVWRLGGAEALDGSDREFAPRGMVSANVKQRSPVLGLDYPPLTAYISYIFGKIAQVIVPELVEETISRGCESSGCIVFMRSSVILCDLLIYIPAAVWISNKVRSNTVLMLLALHPTRLLIDHGHFQYNGVCLGLSLMAVVSICEDYDVLGSILFTLALNFKQMALYHSPVYFLVLLGKSCLRGIGAE